MDVSAPTTRKGAAKCDKHCELQDWVNQQNVEHMLPFRVFLKTCLLQCLLFLCGVTQFSRFRVSVYSLGGAGNANVEHLLRE